MTYLVEFNAITKMLLTFREITFKKLPKIFNYQKSQKNREILPKVIKITKTGHIANCTSCFKFADECVL
jgi:hypothetical protein